MTFKSLLPSRYHHLVGKQIECLWKSHENEALTYRRATISSEGQRKCQTGPIAIPKKKTLCLATCASRMKSHGLLRHCEEDSDCGPSTGSKRSIRRPMISDIFGRRPRRG